jgi:hypothetical protein
MRTYDTFFHLAAGRWIVEHRTLPIADPFSFTFAGAPWNNHSPLAQVAFYLIHRTLGFAGLTVFQAVSSAILVLIPLLFLRARRQAPGLGLALPLLPVLAFRETLEPRPHVIAFILFQLFAVLCLQWIRTRRSFFLLLTPLVYAIWLFVHGSHALILVLLLFLIIVRLTDRDPLNAGVALGAFSACFFLMLILRPEALSLGFRHVSSLYLSEVVAEWKPMTAETLLFTWSGWTFLALWTLSLFGLVHGTGLIRNSRGRRDRLSRDQFCIIAFMMLLALTSRRMAPLFLIAGAPFWLPPAIRSVRFCLAPMERRMSRTFRVVTAWAIASLLAAVVWAIPSVFSFGSGIDADRFPKAAVDYLENSNTIQRLYNAYNYGGYLIYRRIPSQGVFIDGRAITVYPAEFLTAFYTVYQKPNTFDALAASFRVDGVLLPIQSAQTRRLLAYLKSHPGWRKKYQDRQAIIFARTITPTLKAH